MNDPTPATTDPTIYYTKPLETWTFVDLRDALGPERTADVLGTSRGNVRMLKHRGAASLPRMQALQAAIREDEDYYRKALVTIRATGAFRRA